jgi:hypothetical protein
VSGEGTIDARRPLDTSTLGAIRVEPNAIAERARVVREALRHIACDPECIRELPFLDRDLAWGLCTAGSDETLAELGRLLK